MILFVDDSDTGQDSMKDPTPDQIRRRAAAIREGWSEAQRKSRRVAAISYWLPPFVYSADVAANVSSVQSN